MTKEPLEIVLLGGLQVRAAGKEIDLPGRKERALLAMLALPAGEPRSRDKLAGLLWSDRADTQARDSLKQALFKLRRSLDGVQPSPLRADRDVVSLERAAVAVDVTEFERLIGEGTMAALARATALYRGDLLDGLDLRDPAFDEWLLMERQRLRDLARDALARLLDQSIAGGARDQAAAAARRLLALDPLRESAHRALMQIYAEQGQTALALKQYQLCRDALQGELGVRPEAETERLYRSIQEKRTTARRSADRPPAAQVDADASPTLDAPPPAHDPDTLTSVEKTSIAVLPFVNLSGDPEQEFFVDGLTEDIIGALSRISALWVIARTSTFTYKGKPADVKRVAQELGVRYVMEGSVRRAGERLRVTAQLIDAATAHQVWAERYDRRLADLFDIQDEITRSVAASTETQVVFAERQAAESRPSIDFRARDLVVRAWARSYDQTPEAIEEASDLVEEAMRINPSNPTAHRVRAAVFLNRFWIGETQHDAANATRAFELARTALRLAPRDEYAHLVMAWAWAYAATGRLEDAVAECERGLEINPNCSLLLGNLGYYLAALGRSQEAIEACRLSLRLNPRDPSNFWRHQAIAAAHFVAADYVASLQESKRIARSRPQLPSAIIWAASAAALDKADEARTALEYCLAQRPDLHVGSVVPRIMLRFARDEDHERLLELLRKAGLPRESPPHSTSASKPAIAVLPFTNLSGDPEQQYFSDGLAEDIITELSRYRSLLVIARNSCFQFRGPSIDIAAVRSKLGIRYVVEGSVRRVGTRLHLTARLIDALNESHVWAERYDRDVEDIFTVQDDMTRAIAATLEGRVAASGAEQARRRPTRDWQAYDYFLQGRELGHRYDFVGSEPYFARAIELDPRFAQAHAWRANALIAKYWDERRVELLDEALQSARTALSLDDADAWCHLMMGFVLSHRGQLVLAGPYVERAIALNPTDVHIAIHRAWWLARVGRTDEAIEALDVAMHRDPFPPQWLWECRAIALMQARRYEDAIHALGRTTKFHVWDHAYLAACYARLNRAAEARAAAAEVLRMDPQFTVRRYGQLEQFRNPADHEHLLDGMRKAGLPE